jgi:AraC-like DNA-binding protein
MQITLETIIYIIAGSQGVFFAAVMLGQRHGHPSRFALATLALLLTWALIENIAMASGLANRWPQWFGWAQPVPLLIGPVMLWHINLLLGRPKFNYHYWFIHIAPAMIILLVHLPALIVAAPLKQSGLEMAMTITAGDLHPLNWAIAMFKFVHPLIYLIVCWRFLYLANQNWRKSWSSDHLLSFLWLVKCNAVFTLFMAGYVIMLLVAMAMPEMPVRYLESAAAFIMASMILLISYWQLTMPALPTYLSFDWGLSNDKPPEIVDGVVESVAKLVVTALEQDKLYKQPGLKLAELASKVGASTHVVSEAINQKLGLSFFDLINTYRVKDAANKLICEQYRQVGIETIAFECGFNNRVSFSNYFKRVYECTPSDYRANHS